MYIYEERPSVLSFIRNSGEARIELTNPGSQGEQRELNHYITEARKREKIAKLNRSEMTRKQTVPLLLHSQETETVMKIFMKINSESK